MILLVWTLNHLACEVEPKGQLGSLFPAEANAPFDTARHYTMHVKAARTSPYLGQPRTVHSPSSNRGSCFELEMDRQHVEMPKRSRAGSSGFVAKPQQLGAPGMHHPQPMLPWNAHATPPHRPKYSSEYTKMIRNRSFSTRMMVAGLFPRASSGI
jgi:hypothetical protein